MVDTFFTITGRTYFDGTAIPGRDYEYGVRGKTLCGPSSLSPPFIGRVPPSPGTPGTVMASDSLCSVVQLVWLEGVPAGLSYDIYRDTDLIANLPPGSESYDDAGGTAGVTYEYKVAAIGECDTAWAVSGFGFKIDPPPDVTFIQATEDRCSDVKINWNATVGSFDYYVVYRGGDSLGTVHPDSTREFFDTAIDSIAIYTYTVRSRNICGLSNIVSTDTGNRIGLPPTLISCDASDDKCTVVEVSWVPSPDSDMVDGYVVRRDDDSLAFVPFGTDVFHDSFATVGFAHSYSVEPRNGCGFAVNLCTDTGILGVAPPTPYGVSATDSLCDYVLVEWDSTEGAFLIYEIYRTYGVNPDGDLIGTVGKGDSTVFADSLVDSLRVASYWLRIRSSCGLSAPGPSDDGMRVGLPPTPTACVATDELCGRVTVAWSDATEGASVDRYVVSRDGLPIDTLTSPPYQSTDEDADSNTAHLYEVAAWNACGRSVGTCADSGRALTSPGPPTNFTASQEGCGEVVLNWNPPVGGGPIDGYRITRGNPLIITEVDAATLQFADVPPESETVYTLHAFNCEESVGVVDTGRTVGAIPSPPANCSVELLDCNTLEISWEPTPTATEGYVIMREGAIRIDSVGSGVLSVTDSPPQDGVTYEYSIFSLNSCGGSAEPCRVEGRLPGPIDSPPEGSCSASTDLCDGIQLDWYAAGGEDSDVWWLKIYRLPGNILLDSLAPGDSTWLDTGIDFGDTSTYRIVPGNPCHTPAVECTVGGKRPALPSEPVNCAATNDQCEFVTLSWEHPVIADGVIEFNIYRKLSPSVDPFELHAVVTPSIGANSWNDTDVVSGRTYLYRMAAVNRCGETPGECQVQGGIITTRPGPALISPDGGAEDLDLPIVFSWGSVSSVTGYRLVIAVDDQFAVVVVDTFVTAESAAVGNIDFDHTYFWTVHSMNDCGTGPSGEVRRFVMGDAPGIDLVAGSPRLYFGNGLDSLFEDSTLTIRNMGKDTLDWWIEPDPDWISFEPASGTLPGGRSATIVSGVSNWRCGEGFTDTLEISIDPPRESREPIKLFADLLPPPRPAGDFNWDCVAGLDDMGSILGVILGLEEPAAGESLGADVNEDGRITVADLVLFGNILVEGEIAPSRGGPPVEFTLTGNGGSVLSIQSTEPFRALRLKARLDGEGEIVPIDPTTTIVLRDDSGRDLSLLWFGEGENGLHDVDLFRIEEFSPAKAAGAAPGDPIVFYASALELLGTDADVWRPVIDGSPLTPLEIPSRLVIRSIRPNPFNALTVIDFSLPAEGHVEIGLFDIRGAFVRRLLDETRDAGPHQVSWDGTNESGRQAASGIYFVRVRMESREVTRRMTLLR